MKYDLHPSVSVLTHTPEFESTGLFGMNLDEKIKDISEAQHVGKVTVDNQYNKHRQFLGRQRSHPYPRQECECNRDREQQKYQSQRKRGQESGPGNQQGDNKRMPRK